MKPITLSGIEEYAAQHTSPDGELLLEIAKETYRNFEAPQMMVGPVGGRFLEMLVYALRPRLVLEIGTYTGYSALAMASVLPSGSQIITCEQNPRHAATAQKHIASSIFADRITVKVGSATETIAHLQCVFDFVFIDADKINNLTYFEAVLPKLSEDGLIAVDNTLWNGAVLNNSMRDAETAAIKHFNDTVAADPRVHSVLLTVRDGITLIRPATRSITANSQDRGD